MRAPAWTRGDLLVAGGVAVAMAATADTVLSLHQRFAVDLGGLSPWERAAVGLWDFRPLGPAVFAAAALVLDNRLPRVGPARPLLVAFLSAYAALSLAVLGPAVWVASRGSVGAADELGFRFAGDERAVTLATQVLAWGPLLVLFSVLALRTAEREEPEPEPPSDERSPLSEEMDALWRTHLAFGPKRQRARALLGRIRELEEAGDEESARALADEMRRL